MKKYSGVIAAILMFCCAWVIGPATLARAEGCATQGSLALALADVLGIKVATAQEAADALVRLGVQPTAGWRLEVCLTDAVIKEISKLFTSLKPDAGAFDRALGMINYSPDRNYPAMSDPQLSPYKP